MTGINDRQCDEDDVNSVDEALCEMLGLRSLDVIIDLDDGGFSGTDNPQIQSNQICIIEQYNSAAIYKAESVCLLPKELSVSAALMRRLTDELVWGGDKVQSDRSYESIKVLKASGQIVERRSLTRLENFVNFHKEWKELCIGHLQDCVSALLHEPMVLYKEKLNLKPPGGSGFAPHLDTPSLRVPLGNEGPQTFVTVMVAIDDMTEANGCLRVSKGHWSEHKHCELVEPKKGDNPDAGGREGAIPSQIAEALRFEAIECQGGDICIFNGWVPHRSAPNASHFPRRAVFLTYNPRSEGDFHDRYYQRMDEIRQTWREAVGLSDRNNGKMDVEMELKALSTIPRI